LDLGPLKEALSLFGAIWVTALAIVIYLLPSFIVLARRRNNALAIIALNILLGWTFIGWVVALVWALTGGGNRR
jgi:hypothetical protein